MRTGILSIFLALLGFSFAAPSKAGQPYAKPNNSWITLSGSVDSVQRDRFRLDYGDGFITVEMDDGDRDADGYKLVKGDRVMVSGRVDADLFEKTTIEAASVYVENIGTTFYASSIDDEDPGYLVHYQVTPIIPSLTILRGTVSKINGREFTIKSDHAEFTVDTTSMRYNPLDDDGYLKIDKGDRLTVYGRMTEGFFDGRKIRADSIVEIQQPEAKKPKQSS